MRIISQGFLTFIERLSSLTVLTSGDFPHSADETVELLALIGPVSEPNEDMLPSLDAWHPSAGFITPAVVDDGSTLLGSRRCGIRVKLECKLVNNFNTVHYRDRNRIGQNDTRLRLTSHETADGGNGLFGPAGNVQ
jgi:hypothetical protein